MLVFDKFGDWRDAWDKLGEFRGPELPEPRRRIGDVLELWQAPIPGPWMRSEADIPPRLLSGPRCARSDAGDPNPGEHMIECEILVTHFDRAVCLGQPLLDGVSAYPLVKDSAGRREGNVEADLLLLAGPADSASIFVGDVKVTDGNPWTALVQNLRQLRLFTANLECAQLFDRRRVTANVLHICGAVIAPKTFYSKRGQKANTLPCARRLSESMLRAHKVRTELLVWNSGLGQLYPCMSLRDTLEEWQVQWAECNGIRIGAPLGNPSSCAMGYVTDLKDNLFEPLSERVKLQFIAGAGGELRAPDGQSGNMYAVYSSSALCVNLFHHRSRLLDSASPDSKPSMNPLLTACGIPERPVKSIDFEVPNIVNPRFKTPPHLDVQISFDDGPWKCAGIEAKFCEPYDDKKHGGLMQCYLRETALWRDWPNVRAFARELSPEDLNHSHFHAVQLLKHLLGLRKQNNTSFVLVYLWFDVPGAEAAMRHRREIESFGEVLKRDGVAFASRTYQEVFDVLRGENGEPRSPYVTYLLERYLDDAPCSDNGPKL